MPSSNPGVPNPQAVQSVRVHLMALDLVLEAGWPTDRLVRIRQLAADGSAGWAWLEPPPDAGSVTAVDVAGAAPADRPSLTRAWVDGAWQAWSSHHPTIRADAARLVDRLG